MKSKLEEIKEFIQNHVDDKDGQVIETGDFIDIEELISYVNKKFNCDIKIERAGGFDSPGFDVDCYAWAGIIDGELYFETLEQKRY